MKSFFYVFVLVLFTCSTAFCQEDPVKVVESFYKRYLSIEGRESFSGKWYEKEPSFSEDLRAALKKGYESSDDDTTLDYDPFIDAQDDPENGFTIVSTIPGKERCIVVVNINFDEPKQVYVGLKKIDGSWKLSGMNSFYPDSIFFGIRKFPVKCRVKALSGLTLRKSPTLSGEKLLRIENNTVVQVKSVCKELLVAEDVLESWVCIDHDGKEGYVFGGFLVLDNPSVAPSGPTQVTTLIASNPIVEAPRDQSTIEVNKTASQSQPIINENSEKPLSTSKPDQPKVSLTPTNDLAYPLISFAIFVVATFLSRRPAPPSTDDYCRIWDHDIVIPGFVGCIIVVAVLNLALFYYSPVIMAKSAIYLCLLFAFTLYLPFLLLRNSGYPIYSLKAGVIEFPLYTPSLLFFFTKRGILPYSREIIHISDIRKSSIELEKEYDKEDHNTITWAYLIISGSFGVRKILFSSQHHATEAEMAISSYFGNIPSGNPDR